MRDIKFRAWDGKEMHGGDSVVIYVNNGWIEKESLDCNAIHIRSDVNVKFLMQYTGLTDKNGVEIFTGDIMKWDPVEWGGEFSEVVTWDYELFNARRFDWAEWCEVVGNIYANPELTPK